MFFYSYFLASKAVSVSPATSSFILPLKTAEHLFKIYINNINIIFLDKKNKYLVPHNFVYLFFMYDLP